MPYKSNAQRRKFHAMEARGEISPKVVAEYDAASKGKKLPEHVKAKPHAFAKGLRSAARKAGVKK